MEEQEKIRRIVAEAIRKPWRKKQKNRKNRNT